MLEVAELKEEALSSILLIRQDSFMLNDLGKQLLGFTGLKERERSSSLAATALGPGIIPAFLWEMYDLEK